MSRSKLLIHFGLLLLVWGIGVLIYLNTPSFVVKRLDIIAMAAVYPVWGTWHHYENGHVSFSIVLEYVLVALILMVGFLAILPTP